MPGIWRQPAFQPPHQPQPHRLPPAPAEDIAPHVQAVDGTLAAAGALSIQVHKAVAGVLTSGGVLSRLIATLRAGSLTTAGAASRQTQRRRSGTLSTSGALAAIRTVLVSLDGELPMSGALTVAVIPGVVVFPSFSGGGFRPRPRLHDKALAGRLDLGGSLQVAVTRGILPSAAKILEDAEALLALGCMPAETCALLGIDHVPAELRDLEELAVAGVFRTRPPGRTLTPVIDHDGEGV